jgi:hypothetical protein
MPQHYNQTPPQRRPLNALEQLQRKMRHQSLDRNASIRTAWKRYLSRTEGVSRMTKSQWYDFNYPKGAENVGGRLRARHEEIY